VQYVDMKSYHRIYLFSILLILTIQGCRWDVREPMPIVFLTNHDWYFYKKVFWDGGISGGDAADPNFATRYSLSLDRSFSLTSYNVLSPPYRIDTSVCIGSWKYLANENKLVIDINDGKSSCVKRIDTLSIVKITNTEFSYTVKYTNAIITWRPIN
jgi:hypothetical protein